MLGLSTLFVLQFTLSLSVLTAISLVSTKLTKALCIVLVIGNSLALYFMNTYGVVLDRAMMGNVFATNLAETADLAHPQALGYVIVLGALPSVLIWKTTVSAGSRRKRAVFLVVTLMVGASWLYANSKSWLWIDQHAKVFGGLILPWSYVANSMRHYDAVKLQPEYLQLPPARVDLQDKAVVVLVIGESARAKNFSLYGYARQTNPLLTEAGVVVMPNAESCSTYTTQSLRCILSHAAGTSSGAAAYEPLPNYLARQGVEVIWRSNNSGEPPITVSKRLAADDVRKDCRGDDCKRLDYDEVLFYGLEAQIRNTASNKVFVVLHQSGSHGPQYFKKYPTEFERFKPVCRTVDLQKCDQQELINAYDNSILYTDYVLGNVVDVLRKLEGVASAMFYVSDHGESLGEYGLYLHGTPSVLAPDFQTKIPFIVWMSQTFVAQRGLSGRLINSGSAYSQNHVFHSVMGGLGLKGGAYQVDLDIFTPKQPGQ